MSAEWADILDGLVANLQTVSPGLKVTDFYRDSLTVGVEGLAEIGPTSGSGATNMEHAMVTGDAMVFFVTVSLYLNTVVEDAAQTRMLAYLSRGNSVSVWDAFDELGALAGVARKSITKRSHSYGNIVRDSGIRLLTNSWDIEVWAHPT